MKSFMDNVYVKLAIFSSVYVTVLIFVSPTIDHLFTSLEQDKAIKESNFQILLEIILHVVVLVIAWYTLHTFLKSFLEKALNVTVKEQTRTAIDFISAIALVGLQKNLLDKLEYITIEHPFRFTYLS